MVNTPICSFCAQTGMLCQSCQRKMDDGTITQDDVTLARELIKLENQFPQLKELTLLRIIHSPDFNILVVEKGNIPSLIGPKGRILKILENTINKRLRVIEKGSNYIKVIEDLLSPLRVLGINKIFLPTGETVQKVRIQRGKGIRIKYETEELEKLVYNITGKLVRFSFE